MHAQRVLQAALLAALSGIGAPDRFVPIMTEHDADDEINAIAIHSFSTLFTAYDVMEHLATSTGRRMALQWCHDTNISKVYLETYLDGMTANSSVLQASRHAFEAAGIAVSGGICTTFVGKRAVGPHETGRVSCYTNQSSQDRLVAHFEYAAKHFDEIIVDDFFFTNCQCSECQTALKAGDITVGRWHSHFHNKSDASCPIGCPWANYRTALMAGVSKRVLAAARGVNPVVNITLKYPQWYDSYQDNGYDVMQQTAVFSAIFAGTEARNYADQKWGGFPAYTSFFVMRWLTDVAAASRHKVNGGWYDASGTSPASYLEQARQTILGGARESFLFSYGGLQSGVPADDVAVLRQHQAELSSVAAEVAQRDLVGILAYKPPNSHGGCRSYFGHECARGEVLVYSFVGMLGFPLLPTSTFPNQARSAFFSVHALYDKNFTSQLVALLHTGATVLLTDGLADAINTTEVMHALLRRPTVRVLRVNGDPARLLSHPPPELPALRAALLGPLGV